MWRLPLLHPPRAAAVSCLMPSSWLPLVRASHSCSGSSCTGPLHSCPSVQLIQSASKGRHACMSCKVFLLVRSFCTTHLQVCLWTCTVTFAPMLRVTNSLHSCLRPCPAEHMVLLPLHSVCAAPLPLDVLQQPWPCCCDLMCMCLNLDQQPPPGVHW